LIDKNKFALAAGATLGAWSIICAALVALAPELTARLFSWMVHLVNFQAEVSFPEAAYGVVEVFVLTYVTAYVFAWLHNRFTETA